MKKTKKQPEQEKLDLNLFFKGAILSPINNIDDCVTKIKDPKIIATLAGFLSLLTTVLNLLATMVSSVFIKTCDFWTGKCKTQIDFGKLNNLDYVDLVFKGLLKYAIIIFVIAAVYHIGALIIKKNSTYFNSLALICAGIVPSMFANILVGHILGILYDPFNLFIVTLGNVYSILILTFTTKKVLQINDDNKVILYNALVLMFVHILYYIITTGFIFS